MKVGKLPVFIMSGDGGLQEQEKAEDAGSTDFIVKPIELKALQTKLKD